MEMLTGHDRPLFGRAREMVVAPFSVGDTARMLDLPADRAADAFDTQMVTGGYPRLLVEWRRHPGLGAFLDDQLADDNSELVVMGQRVLDAEFPRDLQAAAVLRTIGSGKRAFAAIAGRAGLEATPLSRTLKLLADKRVIAVDVPTSTKPAKLSRYRVADPYLRFWLRFAEPGVGDSQGRRPDLARARITRSWVTYRGRAVEPLVREALTRLAASDPALGGAEVVGGWWPRGNDPEVDRLLSDRALVPGGAAAAPVAVARTTCTAAGVAFYDPARLLAAW